jgi:hypothetical protein
MDPLMKELIRVTDSYKCAIKGTGTANPSEVHEIIQLYIYIYILTNRTRVLGVNYVLKCSYMFISD